MKWSRYYIFFLFLFISLLFLSPISVKAQSVSGSAYLYVGQGRIGSTLPAGYVSSSSFDVSFPTQNYTLINGIDTNNQIVTTIKQILFVTSGYNYTVGNSYTLDFTIDKGSYLVFGSSLYSWNGNRSLYYCGATGDNNQLSQCTLSWTINSDEQWVGHLRYTPLVSSNNFYFIIGNGVNESNVVFVLNNYTSSQGIRISAFNVELDSSGTSDIINNQNQNTQNIINNQNQNTQNIINSQQETTDAINDINDTLKDDTLPDVIHSGGGGGTYFDDINQSSDTPISDLLLLPTNLLINIESSLLNSCSSYTIPFDFSGGNNTLTFPCINIEDYIGNDLWNIIDGLFSIFMFYNIGMLVIKFFEDSTSLHDTFDDLFNPNGGVL